LLWRRAFCRMGHGQIADYKTGQGDRLEILRRDTANALAGNATDNLVFAGLARVVQTHDIDHRHPYDLLKGFEMDVSDRIYNTVDDILDYSYHVAGVVGVMMAHIMGVRDAATLNRASDLGLAFQLTNIARDVVDDARAGRVFIPKDLLKQHGSWILQISIMTVLKLVLKNCHLGVLGPLVQRFPFTAKLAKHSEPPDQRFGAEG